MLKRFGVVLCFMALTASPVFAEAPSAIPVQGVLTDANGAVVNDVFAVTFTLYADSQGTTTLWSEESPVNFVEGYFTAYLGATTALDLTTFRDNGTVFLGVKVADDEEMTPFELGSAPFAGFAEYAGFAADITDAAKVQIVGDVAVQLDNDGKVHDKYTDAEAIAAVTSALSTDTTQLEAALGAEGDANPLNHARYTDAEAVAALASHTNDASAHHARYTDTEAVAAVTAGSITVSGSITASDASELLLNAGDANAGFEMRSPTGGKPYIDLSNDDTTDFDARLQLDDDDTVVLSGAKLRADVERVGPYGYQEFTTDLVIAPNNAALTETVATIRCSGHWGSYAAEIDVITYYYRPGVRRYSFYCGHTDYVTGGTLTELTSQNTGYGPGGLATLSHNYVGFSGFQNSGIDMHDATITITQPAYAQTYLRVRAYGRWASNKAGTPLSDTTPFVVWETWN